MHALLIDNLFYNLWIHKQSQPLLTAKQYLQLN